MIEKHMKNFDLESITVSPTAGSHINCVIEDALTIARRYQCNVKFSFNGEEMEVTPGDTLDKKVSEWEKQLADKHAVYKASDEYKEKQKREAELGEATVTKANSAVSSITYASKAKVNSHFHSSVLDILRAIDSRLVHKNSRDHYKSFLLSKLTTVGFVRGEHVGKDKDFLDKNPNASVEWIYGQLIDVLKRDCGIMPFVFFKIEELIEDTEEVPDEIGY